MKDKNLPNDIQSKSVEELTDLAINIIENLENKKLLSNLIGLEASKISKALIYADAGLWDKAFDSIGINAEEPFQNLIEWLKLRSGNGSVKSYISFIDSNPHWPGMQLLRKKAEQKIYTERSKHGIKVHQDILKVFDLESSTVLLVLFS